MDPVHENADGWYFWEECWAWEYGPYMTRGMCVIALHCYCKYFL